MAQSSTKCPLEKEDAVVVQGPGLVWAFLRPLGETWRRNEESTPPDGTVGQDRPSRWHQAGRACRLTGPKTESPARCEGP
jgi:hypothetical protein